MKNPRLFDPDKFAELLFQKRTADISRAAKIVTLREIGRETGMSSATICRIEQGCKSPTVENFLRVALWMDLPGIRELLESVKGEKPKP